MKRHDQTMPAQHSRRDARAAWVRGWEASVAMSHTGVVAMLGTLFTTKINPRVASGGLPREGDS